MLNGWELFFLGLAALYILICAMVGAATLGRALKEAIQKHEDSKPDMTHPAEASRMCKNKPHKWEHFRILNVDEVEPFDTPEQIEAKTRERLTCVDCGFVSGTTYMLDKKTIKRLLTSKLEKDYEKRVFEIMREKRTKVIAEYTEKYSISADALDQFDLEMANLPSQAKLEAYKEMVEKLGNDSRSSKT